MPFRRQKRVLEFVQLARVSRLEADRRAFWLSIQGRDERPLYRSQTLSLIAAAPFADATMLQATCRELVKEHPCTVFLVLLSRAEHPLRAQWGARVLESEHSQTVLAEELVMHVGAQDRVLLPSLIRPLLSGDVPSVTFWSAELPRDPSVVDALGSMTDELVFDSSLLEHPADDARRICRNLHETRDLTWQRLAPWRRAMAEAFEHLRWSGRSKSRARIQHVGSAGSHAAATTLSHWLTTRLGTEVRIDERPRCLAPSFEPCMLEFSSDDGSIEIAHEWPEPRLRISVSTLPEPFHSVAPSRSRGALLSEAIEDLSTNGHSGATRPPAGQLPLAP
ncbi:MAG: glucose-6-phosphate dehydrogenase assembly protein OpcA [Planctomycetota bacterium]